MLEDPFCDNLSGITQIHLPNETLEVRLKMLNPEVRTLFCLNGAEVKRIIDVCIAMSIRVLSAEEARRKKDAADMYEVLAEETVPAAALNETGNDDIK